MLTDHNTTHLYLGHISGRIQIKSLELNSRSVFLSANTKCIMVVPVTYSVILHVLLTDVGCLRLYVYWEIYLSVRYNLHVINWWSGTGIVSQYCPLGCIYSSKMFLFHKCFFFQLLCAYKVIFFINSKRFFSEGKMETIFAFLLNRNLLFLRRRNFGNNT